jgi:Major Facilitator Superfamily
MWVSEALHRTGNAARATTGAVRSGARAGASATRKTGGFVHRVTGASGAGRTGLSTLIELTAASSAGDAFVIIALAGTIFFDTSVDQARGKVALFLVVTMAPFAVLAPFIGPALDRVQQGRRYLLAGTLLARGLLCWGMSAAVHSSVTLLPAAFGVLVLQKAYGVVRASVAPRLLPEQITLVTANARSQLFAVIGATIAAALAEGIQVTAGAAWVLRAGMVIYLAAMFLAFRLPDQVDVLPPADPAAAQAPGTAPNGADGSAGPAPSPTAATAPQPNYFPNERRRYPPARASGPGTAESGPLDDTIGYQPAAPGRAPRYAPAASYDTKALPPGSATRPDGAAGSGRAQGPRTAAGTRHWRTLSSVGPVVAEAMTGNAVLRAFSGYTFFFFAFLLQTVHFGVSKHFALAVLAFAVAAGSIFAMAVGSLLKSRAPQLILFATLTAAPVVAAIAAFFFGLAAVIAVAFAAILCASLAKLAQDSIVQREIGDEIRSSTFAVSETLNAVANVAGGLAGVLVSILDSGQAGLAIAAALLTAALFLLVARRRRRILAERRNAEPRPARPRGRR